MRRRRRGRPAAPSLPWQSLLARAAAGRGRGSLRRAEGRVHRWKSIILPEPPETAIQPRHPHPSLVPGPRQSHDRAARAGGEAAPPWRCACCPPRCSTCSSSARRTAEIDALVYSDTARHARGASRHRRDPRRGPRVEAPGPRDAGASRAGSPEDPARAPLPAPRPPYRSLARRVARAGAAPALVGRARAREPLLGLELHAPLQAATPHDAPRGGSEPRRAAARGHLSRGKREAAGDGARRRSRGARRRAPPEAGISARGFVQVHPASRWLFKTWTEAKNAEMLRALARDGHRIVVTGAPDSRERAIVARIIAEADVPVLDLSGQLTLRELAALSARARLFFGVDSAPMHIAAAWARRWWRSSVPAARRSGGRGACRTASSPSTHPAGRAATNGCGGGKVSECLTLLPVDLVRSAVNELLAQR